MPAQFGELSFGTRKADNKPIKLKYWEPSPYSYEELKIFHRVLVDGEPFDPKIIDYRWKDGAAYNQEDQKAMDKRNGKVRATHGFFPPFMSWFLGGALDGDRSLSGPCVAKRKGSSLSARDPAQ